MIKSFKVFWKKLFFPYNNHTYQTLLLLEQKEQHFGFLASQLPFSCSSLINTIRKLEDKEYVERRGNKRTGVLFAITPDGSIHLEELCVLYTKNK